MKSIQSFKKIKLKDSKLTMITCYDYSFAKIIADTNIDMVLVGDSAAMVMAGFKNTIPATIEMMEYHISSVARALKGKFLVGDMPFLEHRKNKKQTMNSIDILMKAGANAIKIEGGQNHTKIIKYIVDSGVPIMGHLGLTPQSVNALGGWKLQGNSKIEAEKIYEDALQLERSGVFAIVLEMIPEKLAKKITDDLQIPTIGIGAGAYTSGQVLVLQDLLGMSNKFNPSFVRKYFNGYDVIRKALNSFDDDVKKGSFPGNEEIIK
jgi:3-methyl-2-oxobutanoate hydroxymethyltransferase